ncbi:MAG: YqgE/AlgH family protein [Candidatus Rokubacteria bacterium]|nr:YqgE/AlgH family protein [Candidatus Rokubacteria bacterium]
MASLLVLAPAAARPEGASVAGQLLVAAPSLRDPSFSRTVVFMLRHDQAGAMGLVINRPLGEMPLAALLAQAGLGGAGAAGTVRMHFGGPVERGRLFVLHTGDYAASDTLRVGGLAVTAQVEILQAIAGGRGPRRAVLALGCAGWSPGQLEAEMEAGHWIIASPDEAIVFDDALATKWDRAMARRRTTL